MNFSPFAPHLFARELAKLSFNSKVVSRKKINKNLNAKIIFKIFAIIFQASQLMHFRCRWKLAKDRKRENVDCNKNPMSLEIIISTRERERRELKDEEEMEKRWIWEKSKRESLLLFSASIFSFISQINVHYVLQR